MRAKSVSLFAIILACAWIGVLSLLRGFTPVIWAGRTFGLSVADILLTGVAFVVVCTPIYRSIWLDKKFGIKSSDDGKCITVEDIVPTESKSEEANQPVAGLKTLYTTATGSPGENVTGCTGTATTGGLETGGGNG